MCHPYHLPSQNAKGTMRYLLGMDDTDSRLGHCTTHLCYLLVDGLLRVGCSVGAYPRLVRLNPNIPFKTRGNAAVCIEFNWDGDPTVLLEVAMRLLKREADVANGANSGVILTEASFDAQFFKGIYKRAIHGVVSYRAVMRSVEKMGLRHIMLGNGMGLVGAAASLGFDPKVEDHTYELIAYRKPDACGTAREVDAGSVRAMDSETFPHTFNNYDHRTDKVLIAPSGPDPVLVGIRGDSPQAVLHAYAAVRLKERPLGHMIYASNQCTDAHLTSMLSRPLKAYSAGWLEGSVAAVESSQGGHILIELSADDCLVECIVYEPAGDLRHTAKLLSPGDLLKVYGGVRRGTSRHPTVINLEKIEVLEVRACSLEINPVCECGVRMKSEGRGKGFQCGRCGRRSVHGSKKKVVLERSILPGIYLPSSRGQRHLTKQLIRYGNEATAFYPLIDGWMGSGRPSVGEQEAPLHA